MSRAFSRFSRHATRWPLPASCFPPRSTRADFYREEFLRHKKCLETQREYFSAQAIHDVEHALQNILSRLDSLCHSQDCDEVMSTLLKKFDLVTRLSVWDDRRRTH